jgi:hypothetical protein
MADKVADKMADKPAEAFHFATGALIRERRQCPSGGCPVGG